MNNSNEYSSDDSDSDSMTEQIQNFTLEDFLNNNETKEILEIEFFEKF